MVFCDVTGSTALGEATDPEALRALLARYFERMRGIVESHGGTVEKFIGDAVMAVFGVPVVHEDDALRACRAAVEMRDALPELGIAGRIGVNTGEVVTGTPERLATGDAVNVAARLEQAAAPGEILIGEETLRLVSAAVEVGAGGAPRAEGEAAPVPAYRLVSVLDAPARSHASRFVGRSSGARDAGGGVGAGTGRVALRARHPASVRRASASRGSSPSSLAGVDVRSCRAAACRTGKGSRTGRWWRC